MKKNKYAEHSQKTAPSHRQATFWSKSCLRKKALSEEAAASVIKRAAQEGTILRPYLCHHCCRYHVTSQPKEMEISKARIKELVN